MQHILPVLSARKKQLAGTILVALQIALTLAIISNAMFIIHERIALLSRPTGLTESNLLSVENQWINSESDVSAPLIKSDLTALRHMPLTVDATRMFTFPLAGGGAADAIMLNPDDKNPIAKVSLYFTDDHAIKTMGLRLMAGRNFRPDEVTLVSMDKYKAPPVVVITRKLALTLFPNGSALGKTIYFKFTSPGQPSTIIGILDQMQDIYSDINNGEGSGNSVLVPTMLDGSDGYYFIRTEPGRLEDVAKAVPATLAKISRMRVIPPLKGIRSFLDIRSDAYKEDRGMALIMGVICLLLLLTTGGGIVGFSSFWVNQRRKQIGIRRALGATRQDILGYFLTENLLISITGVLLGAILAVSLNLQLMRHFEASHMPIPYVLAGAAIVIALGQAAAFWPARRASWVLPAEVMRAN